MALSGASGPLALPLGGQAFRIELSSQAPLRDGGPSSQASSTLHGRPWLRGPCLDSAPGTCQRGDLGPPGVSAFPLLPKAGWRPSLCRFSAFRDIIRVRKGRALFSLPPSPRPCPPTAGFLVSRLC